MYESDVERSVLLMKEIYERPMIDEIIFDTKAVMSGVLTPRESIEEEEL